MRVLLSVLHVIVAILMMVLVLLQQRKQGGFSGAFGIGTQADMGQWQRFSGPTKITVVLALVFMVTSLCLVLMD